LKRIQIEAENEDDAVFQALDGFDFGNVKPYVEEMRRKKMADKCTGWAIVATMERPNKTWYTETITDIDDSTAYS
jgi:hypothetical protein